MLASALLLSGFITVIYASGWGYSGVNGPDHWSAMCQAGRKQSPINLDRSSATRGRFFDLVFLNYDRVVAMNVTNNGHTVRVDVEQPCPTLLSGGGLPALFRLEQIHFHWPSEHTLDGNRWPLEIHLVHYDLKYSGIAEAVKHRWGVVVLAILCHEDENGGESLWPLLRAVEQVKRQVGASSRLPAQQSPSSFLPKDVMRWYRYEGSLTTPDCDETVIWTVLRGSLPVSRGQIANFQEIISSRGRIQANNRPLQALNDRIVYLQDGPWDSEHARLSATVMKMRSILVALFVLLVLQV